MNALLVFLKEPTPGMVKTRLAESVGHEDAARRYRALVAVLLQQLEGLKDTHVRFCYAPDDAGDAISFWILPQLRGDTAKQAENFLFTPEKNAPAFTIDFRAQGDGHLGNRLERATSQAFDEGYTKVAVIGSDCIHCGARWINTGFSHVKQDSCVVGPSEDGGYYLLATAQKSPQLFQNINWSSENTRSETELAATKMGLTLVHLPELRDVDDEEDWDHILQSAIGGKLTAALKREV